MKVVTIVGARPQFIKAAPVSRQLRKEHREILVHTGQHYDNNMSEVFFEELDIPRPDYNLGVGSGSHGKQTGEMLTGIEDVLLKEKPDWVLVYGDTNSTLAGALAASKLHIRIAHVEAGLRSYNRAMPEEVNRVLTDHISDLLFCPTETGVKNLSREGITNGIYNCGDVMLDALLYNINIAQRKSTILDKLRLQDKGYVLVTVHRAENTDNLTHLSAILEAFYQIQERIIFPIHPRTMSKIIAGDLEKRLRKAAHITCIEPVGYLDMLLLEKHARKILTDSGGVQKEAFILGVPCITLRRETEWIESVELGGNTLTGPDTAAIINAFAKNSQAWDIGGIYGDGKAAEKISRIMGDLA